MANFLKSGRLPRWLVSASFGSGILLVGVAALAAGTQFFAEPTWQPGTPEAAKAGLDAYLHSAPLPTERKTAVRDLWIASAPPKALKSDLLDRLGTSLSQADPRVAELVDFCSKTDHPAKLPDFSWLADSHTLQFVRNNMRLYYARWLVQNNFDDESLGWTDGLTTADVIAPESLLFYRAVAAHRLVQTDRADATLAELLQRTDELPPRYLKIAILMQKDLAGLDDESLDHIVRRMADVERRLKLARAGDKVQGVEKGVVDSLDKLIKKLEDQAQQQSQSGGQAGGTPGSTKPMQDSRLAELKAPGKVEPRDVGHGANWGNMPDKDREQALQEIGREFPTHYREVIEEYFRQLAAEPADDGN